MLWQEINFTYYVLKIDLIPVLLHTSTDPFLKSRPLLRLRLLERKLHDQVVV
jgi:hypothetical protein